METTVCSRELCVRKRVKIETVSKRVVCKGQGANIHREKTKLLGG